MGDSTIHDAHRLPDAVRRGPGIRTDVDAAAYLGSILRDDAIPHLDIGKRTSAKETASQDVARRAVRGKGAARQEDLTLPTIDPPAETIVVTHVILDPAIN